MFKQLDLTKTGGLYVYQETLDWLQTAYSQLLDGLAAGYGNKVIISGLTPAGGSVSDGWVVVNGVIYPFVGGAVATYVYVETITTNEQYDDGTTKPAYSISRAKFTAVATGSTFLFADLVRLPFATAAAPTLKDALSSINALFKSIINFENCVIISGCAVSAVDTGAQTCTISAGVVMINGNIVAAPLRTASAYPCYLKPDGTYVTAPPAGDYITFDPYTSQYYVDVLRRAQSYSGMLTMSTKASDLNYFDLATGLGKWRWLGFKICDLMQSRVPIGYDRRASDPADGIYDPVYHTVGYKDSAHENAEQIEQENLPHIRLNVTGERGNSYTGGPTSPDTSGSGSVDAGPHDVGQTDYLGDGVAMDTRQSFSVLLFIERI